MGIANALRKANDLQAYVNILGTNERAKLHIDRAAAERAVNYHVGEIEAAIGDKWAGAVKLILKDNLELVFKLPRQGKLASDLTEPITRFIKHFENVLTVTKQNEPEAKPENTPTANEAGFSGVGYTIAYRVNLGAATKEREMPKPQQEEKSDFHVIDGQAVS